MRNFLLAVGLTASFAAHATDYNFGLVPIGTPPGTTIGYSSQALQATYADTATFTFGNWNEPSGAVYEYVGPASIIVQGQNTSISSGGRGARPSRRVTTMPPPGPALMEVDPVTGAMRAAVDTSGKLVYLTYSPASTQFGKVDRWVASGVALPAGTYRLVNMMGTSCSGATCQIGGGSYWFVSLQGTFTYVAPPPPPPGGGGGSDD
ncbi:MAG: hypothetical protein P4L83_10115 [Nevskia sp.]|nr:hypothetical protein [Nevskia sp.]